MPVFKYRLKLTEPPVSGWKAEARSAPACAVPQGCGGERAADVTPVLGKGGIYAGTVLVVCAGTRGTAPSWWRWCVGHEALGSLGLGSG